MSSFGTDLTKSVHSVRVHKVIQIIIRRVYAEIYDQPYSFIARYSETKNICTVGVTQDKIATMPFR